MEYKIHIITGYETNQKFSIPAQEAHKAYYLFNNPEERGVFENGLALRGKDIQRIIPDYNGTLGYNPDYELTYEDYNEIREKGIDQKFHRIMGKANDLSRMKNPHIDLKLTEAIKFLPEENKEFNESSKLLLDKWSLKSK